MRVRNLIAIIWDQIGFESLFDILQNTVAWKHKLTAVYLISFSAAGVFAAARAFTKIYVYAPVLGIEILWATTFLDICFGISLAVYNKTGIAVGKVSRAVVRVLTQTVLVALFFQMSHAWGYLISSWMVDSLLIVFTLSTFYSVLQNAASLGLITKDQYSFIESIVDIKSLIEKLKNKK